MDAKKTTIRLTKDGARRRITLVPAEGKPPVLDPEVLDSLDVALSSIEAEIAAEEGERPRVVILRSASTKYFCVVADLNVLRTLTEDNFKDWLSLGQQVFGRLEALPVPVLAAVGGYALGGGLELAMAADVIIAGQSAGLGLTEAKLGFVPGWGGIFRLAERVGRSRAKRLFFSGEIVNAPEAASIGLIDRVLPDGELEAAVDAMAEAIAGNNAAAVAAFKRVLDAERAEARARVDGAERLASMDCIRDVDTKVRIARFFDRFRKE